MRILPPTAQIAVWRPPGPVVLAPIPYYVGDARRRAPWLRVIDDTDGAPTAAIGRELAGAGRVGFVGVTWTLAAELAGTGTPIDAMRLVQEARAAKLPGEIACVERAIAVAQTGMLAAVDAIAPGVTEQEVAAEAECAMRRLGGDGHAIVGRGDIASGMTELAGPAALRPGDCVLVDLGCYLDGYRGEYARTFCVSEARPAVRDAHRAVERAIEAAEARLGSGASAHAVADAARERLEDAGHPPAALPHPVGHGLGIAGGEPPLVERGSTDRIPDMGIVNLEPGVFDPREAIAVRIEDTYAIEGSSVRRLTTTPRTLTVCG
jgi:Xaa-Pro aminopeptidase